MNPLTIFPVVYVLELEGDEKYPFYLYVGASLHFNARIAQHVSGLGAKWPKVHKFVKIREVILVQEGSALDVENATTLKMIQEYGPERVRGGNYVRV